MAQTYQSNIPALANVANPNVANDLRHVKAPGILQGQNINTENYDAALDEANGLKAYRYRHPNQVTATEVGQAFDRALAIANEHAAGSYAQAMAPPWFNNSLNAALAPIQADIQANQSAIANIAIRIDNQSIKRHNDAVLALRDRDRSTLVPLKKQVAGTGLGLPGRNVHIAPADVVALGASVPVPPFPTTKAELSRLTRNELARLSALYNEDFGIILGDGLDVQRRKFEEFIAYYL